MKRPHHREQWKKGYVRPRKSRERASIYPLPRSTGARLPYGDPRAEPLRVPASRPLPYQEANLTAPMPLVNRRQPRPVRMVAWLILAAVPLAGLVWVLSIVVPIIIETQQASGKIFTTPVDRVHYVTPVATPPVAPDVSPVVDLPPTLTPTIVPTPGATQVQGEPTWTATAPLPTSTAYPAWDGDEPINILLLGVDTRAGETTPPRSDTIIVVRVDPVLERVDILSIPRDLLVDIPGYYATKINAAYPMGELDESLAGGGPTLAAQTVEYNFGIFIHYYAEVDIAGMEKVIDILDGIIIDVPGIVKDEQYPTENFGYTRVYFTPGLQLMDGRTAVRYSRTRHDDGDFARQERQQHVLLALRERALSSGIITKLPEIISEVGDSVRTDLSRRQVLSLARLAQDVGRENIFMHSLQDYVHEESIDGGYYLVGDWDVLRALAADLPSDPNARSAVEIENDPAQHLDE
jgi:LCP family protein required for cell wall assembly